MKMAKEITTSFCLHFHAGIEGSKAITAMSRRISAAVVGAGICGLEAIAILKEEGFEKITCFEKSGYLSGLWKYQDNDTDGVASVMKTTTINTSKEVGVFSNFPPSAEYPNYMHNSLMYEYIKSAAKKNGAEKHIKFFHEVQRIEKTDDYKETGRWQVTSKNTQTGETVSDVFDCVLICIGHHVYPDIHTFPGQEQISGKIMNSYNLKKAQGFEDIRVIAVGDDNSAVDAAVEFSSIAKQNEAPVDAAILCTECKVKYHFLSEDILSIKNNRIKLYKYIFPPDLQHPTLAILGQMQSIGPRIPVNEMQCRWAVRVITGKIALPSKEKMYTNIKKRDNHNRGQFTDSPRCTFQVDFIGYIDEPAEEIGCKPNLLKLAITDPKLFWHVFFEPSSPYQNRFQGPRAWESERDAILTYNERIKATLRRPGKTLLRKQRKLLNFGNIVKILFVLPFLYRYLINSIDFNFLFFILSLNFYFCSKCKSVETQND